MIIRTTTPVSTAKGHVGTTVLPDAELELIMGGTGPIGEALEWYYMTMGSFYRGLWDGLTGQEAKA